MVNISWIEEKMERKYPYKVAIIDWDEGNYIYRDFNKITNPIGNGGEKT